MNFMPFLSVVIPAYNEEQRIVSTLDSALQYLERQTYTFEVLIVDDGSTDRTADVCKTYAAERQCVRLVSLPLNRGKGCAVRTGALNAQGSYVLICDADMATPIEELDQFWPLINEQFDIVIASRAVRNSTRVRHQPWYREFLGRCFNLVVQMLAVPGIKDTQCGFKLLTRRASDSIFGLCKSDGFSFDIEVLYLARRFGFRIAERPVRWYHMEGSKVNVLRDGFATLADILRIRLRHIRVPASAAVSPENLVSEKERSSSSNVSK